MKNSTLLLIFLISPLFPIKLPGYGNVINAEIIFEQTGDIVDGDGNRIYKMLIKI
jgi:hypothetical protein